MDSKMTEDWWNKPYGLLPHQLVLEPNWREWIRPQSEGGEGGELKDLVRELMGYEEEELARVLGCAGMLFHRNLPWFDFSGQLTQGVNEAPDVLMHACLYTATVWERG